MIETTGELYCGIDAGGTSFKCGVYDAQFGLLHTHRVAVSSPQETIDACLEFFRSVLTEGQLKASRFGIASFGPLDLDPGSKTFGSLLDTPKPGWQNAPIKRMFEDGLETPITIDTDVNAALRAERELGAAHGCASAAYITIGTGIGAGIYANGGKIGQPSHPEFGHISVRRAEGDDRFEGLCLFHQDCLEGLASAKAFEARFGDPRTLPPEHPAWQIEADYIAQACRVLHLTFRLERIVLGGGLPQAPALIPAVREHLTAQLNGYTKFSASQAEALVRPSRFNDQAGMIGAALLGKSGAN